MEAAPVVGAIEVRPRSTAQTHKSGSVVRIMEGAPVVGAIEVCPRSTAQTHKSVREIPMLRMALQATTQQAALQKPDRREAAAHHSCNTPREMLGHPKPHPALSLVAGGKAPLPPPPPPGLPPTWKGLPIESPLHVPRKAHLVSLARCPMAANSRATPNYALSLLSRSRRAAASVALSWQINHSQEN